MKNDIEIKKKEFINAVKREKTKNYMILYSVTVLIWLSLVLFSFSKGFFKSGEFIVNVINNIIGILPPILIFDFFNEKLSRDSSAIEMSTKITETLMGNSETLNLFSEEQRKDLIKSAITSVVGDPDAAEMINGNLTNYLSSVLNYRIRTEFDYLFGLNEILPKVYDDVLVDKEKYFWVTEKLRYRVKYLSEDVNNMKTNEIRIGFVFDNKNLDNVLREKKNNKDFCDCIFRESLDINAEDIDEIKRIAGSVNGFKELFGLDLQIDNVQGEIVEIIVKEEGIICKFLVAHDVSASEHFIKIIFSMPKSWGSVLEVALVDPTKAPKITVQYQTDKMEVDMFSFLSKGDESSLETAHEQKNGMYDIAMNNEWVYPISGMVFSVHKK